MDQVVAFVLARKQGCNGPAVGVAADNDLGNVQSRDRVFNARRRGVVVFVRLVGGHEVAHVAQHKELAWGRIGDERRDDPRIGAADEQRSGVLAVGHQVQQLRFVLSEVIALEKGIALKQMFNGLHVRPFCCGPGLTARRNRGGKRG